MNDPIGTEKEEKSNWGISLNIGFLVTHYRLFQEPTVLNQKPRTRGARKLTLKRVKARLTASGNGEKSGQ